MSIEIKNKLSTKGRYRPEIDGLRAFAVIAVIINHFNKDILPGGYLGVDIFFVISGFVITSSLYQRPSKNFKDFISGFYERRIKRLVPALSVFVLITSIAICFFNPAPGVSLKTGLTSLFGLSNIYLLKDSTDYFAQSTEFNLFTHTWSLGVEEQFYILFPFLIWFSGFGRQTKNGARNLFLMVGALTITSLIGFLYFYTTNQPAAYFLMPTRFWEMASGCLIFIGFHKRKSIEQFLEKIPPFLVLLLIIGVMYLPMSLATVSTVSVVALSAVILASLKKGTAAFNIFTDPKVLYIGHISYSLYLWHWGVLSISRWTIGIHWWSVPFQLILMFILAIASYRYIETPFRNRKWFAKRWKNYLFSGGVLVTVSSSLYALGEPLRGILYLGNNNYKHSDIHISNDLLRKKCLPKIKFDLKKVSDCSLSSSNDRYILSIGDSLTGDLPSLLNKFNKVDGFGVYYYSAPGISFPSLIKSKKSKNSDFKILRKNYSDRSLAFFDYYFSKLKKGDIIFLFSKYSIWWDYDPMKKVRKQKPKYTFYDASNNPLNQDESYKEWKKLFDNIAEQSLKKNIKVIVFNSIPAFPNYVFYGGKQWFNSTNKKHFIGLNRKHFLNRTLPVNSTFESLAKRYENVEVFDIFSELCPESQDFCTTENYRDRLHLSPRGVLSLYEGLLNKLN